uniref:Uncharacterized protein n=1 Tax=Ascaris lumbricoides TaxID=6252 RepID=A0A0M3IM46_ASCLU
MGGVRFQAIKRVSGGTSILPGVICITSVVSRI